RLIKEGKLPRPKRTIRILGMGECYGTLYYLEQHQDRMKKTIAGMCIDSPAGLRNLSGTEFTWVLDPHSASSYVDALICSSHRNTIPWWDVNGTGASTAAVPTIIWATQR